MKKMIISFLTIVMVVGLVIPSAYAGEKSRHRWQGAIAGVILAPVVPAVMNAVFGLHPFITSVGPGGYPAVYGNPGAEAAYIRGQAQEMRRYQWDMERRAYNAGRRSINPYVPVRYYRYRRY